MEQNLHDCENNRSKSSSENASLSKLLEDAEHKLGLSKKENKNLESTLQEARQVAEEESKVNILYSFFLRCLLQNYNFDKTENTWLGVQEVAPLSRF